MEGEVLPPQELPRRMEVSTQELGRIMTMAQMGYSGSDPEVARDYLHQIYMTVSRMFHQS